MQTPSKLINPFPVVRHLLEIRRWERSGRAAQLALQRQLLTALVNHAATNVPYYRNRIDPGLLEREIDPTDLAELPVLEREQVSSQRRSGALLADGFGGHNTRASSSSGSSGVPVTVYNSEADLGYLRASYLQDLLACGLRPTDRIAYFRPAGFLRHPLERFGVLPSFQIDTRADVDDQVEAFLAARPTFLTGFPSTISCVVAELRRRGIEYHRVRRVVFGGERVTPALRAVVLDFFGAAGSEVYAAVETFTIARSCHLGSLHLRLGDVVVEVEQSDGSTQIAAGEGEVLVTRLRSEAMPLLRYRLGDRVRFASDPCPCGQLDTPVIADVLGRSQDLIVGSDGRQTSIDALETPLIALPALSQLQVVQDRPGALEVRVVLDPGAGPDVLATIGRLADEAAPDYETTIVAVDRIAPEPNGKVRTVRSTIVGQAPPPVLDPKRPALQIEKE